MKRVYLSENGKWFDLEKATKYDEETYHDGSNFISKSTGSQWEHEILFRTAAGKFILNSWSNFQGRPEKYEIVSKEFAAEWFVKNEYATENIPEELKEYVDNMEEL